MIDIKIGDNFMAIIKKSEYSKTLAGDEGAGRKIGAFTAIGVTELGIETDDRFFDKAYFDFEKC